MSDDLNGYRWMNVSQVCTFFGVSRRTVYVWMSLGKLETRKTPGGGRRLLVNVKEWEPKVKDAHDTTNRTGTVGTGERSTSN